MFLRLFLHFKTTLFSPSLIYSYLDSQVLQHNFLHRNFSYLILCFEILFFPPNKYLKADK